MQAVVILLISYNVIIGINSVFDRPTGLHTLLPYIGDNCNIITRGDYTGCMI